MGIPLWILLGLAAGAAAVIAMPGSDPLGTTGRALLGVGGALCGGLLGVAFGAGSITGVDQSSLTAVIGAFSVLFSYRSVAMRAPE